MGFGKIYAYPVYSIKALLFDFGGTLDSNGRHWLQRVRPLYARVGIPVENEAFDRAFYDADDNLAKRHALDGLDLEEVVHLQVLDVLSHLGADRKLAPRVVRPFVDDARAHLRRNARWLRGLRSGFRLGVVSNFYGNMRSMLKRESLLPLFDVVADSGEVGAMKPDPKIFRAALEPLGLQPAQALMVGDSISRDMRGAEALGMPHAWLAGDRASGASLSPELRGGGERKSPACCEKAIVLRQLQDLEAFIKNPGKSDGHPSPLRKVL